MGDPTGEADKGALRLDFDRRLMLRFRGSTITSDAGLLAYRELDDTLRLTNTGADRLADAHTGKNGRHRLAGLLRQSVFGQTWATSCGRSRCPRRRRWSLTSLREKLIKIGATVVRHGRYVTFQMAKVTVSRQMFAEILSLIARLRAPSAPA